MNENSSLDQTLSSALILPFAVFSARMSGSSTLLRTAARVNLSSIIDAFDVQTRLEHIHPATLACAAIFSVTRPNPLVA